MTDEFILKPALTVCSKGFKRPVECQSTEQRDALPAL